MVCIELCGGVHTPRDRDLCKFPLGSIHNSSVSISVSVSVSDSVNESLVQRLPHMHSTKEKKMASKNFREKNDLKVTRIGVDVMFYLLLFLNHTGVQGKTFWIFCM